MWNSGKQNIGVVQIQKTQNQQDKQCTYNVSLRRFLAATFDTEE